MRKGWTAEKHLRGLTQDTIGFCWTPEHGWVRKNGNVPHKAKRNVSIDKDDPIIVGVHSTAPQSASDPQAPYGEVTIERLERGLALLAYIMMRDGPVVAPLYERLEQELEALRRQQDIVARAKRLLETNSGRRLALAPPSKEMTQ